MKKAIVLFMISIMILGVVGCANDTVNSKNEVTSSVTSQKNKKNKKKNNQSNNVQNNIDDEVEIEKSYIHSAISGAVIVKQDGSKKYVYKEKCDVCGEVDSTTKIRYGSFTTFTTSFLCSCGNMQDVRIESSEIN